MEKLGRYEIENYTVLLTNSQVENRQRIYYHSQNGVDYFVERFFGSIRSGYEGSSSLFSNLNYTDIKTHIIGESIVINDKNTPPTPLIYILLDTIELVQHNDNIVTIIDSNSEPLSLEFATYFDANQAHSIFNYVLQNPDIDIDNIPADTTPPKLFFNDYFMGYYISLNGDISGVPYNSEDGDLFLTDANLLDFGGVISKQDIIDNAIYTLVDNRDGNMSISTGQIIIKDSNDFEINEITSTGEFSITFEIYDIGLNKLEDILVISVN